MRVVIALGGNALLRRRQPMSASIQRENVKRAARALAPIAASHHLIVSHGNGPQVGLLALQAEAHAPAEPYPLDVLGAESEGMIGYLIEQELGALLPERELATVLTMVEIDRADPAFDNPTKPIGPVYREEEARRLSRERGFTVARDGPHWRRVVASPEPRRVLEIQSIRWLLEKDAIVICAGGGGIPVAPDGNGRLEGVEAVIDKDKASALLAIDLGAEVLVLATDVDAVYDDWGTDDARPLRSTTAAALSSRVFEPGSMGPKVEAACRFVATRPLTEPRRAAIGALADVESLVAGTSGTQITR